MDKLKNKKLSSSLILVSVLMLYYANTTKYLGSEAVSFFFDSRIKPPSIFYIVDIFGISLNYVYYTLSFTITLGVGIFLFLFKKSK